jgi:hypothetical protein
MKINDAMHEWLHRTHGTITGMRVITSLVANVMYSYNYYL